ncbi:tetratricopeptide repeat protein [uncultured Bacteroides sp.]|uniref:tetratricopeptide repeat protein n=1 Tax=uncultured Bacteroides sp. TaxID=162156 RepID=UPI0037494E8B
MLKYRYIVFLFLHLFALSLFAQKAERDYIRKGNRSFNDSVFVDAEVNYRKALDANPNSAVAMYNLGNTLSQEKKIKEAVEQYTTAAKLEKDKGKLAKIYHNAGVLFQASKNYKQAVDAYKMSLRNNPKDNETRYNLALALSMLKKQQQQKDKNKDNKQDQKKKDKKDQNKKSKDQKQNQKDKNKQENSKPKKQDNKMSKENAQQLLNSVMQDEKNIQDKVKKQQVMQGGRLEKDW